MTTERDTIVHNRSQLKSQFGNLFDEIEAILFKHDPMEIAYLDHEHVADNPDEYSPEVGVILPRLRTAMAAEDVREIVYEVFLRFFDGEENIGPKIKYEALSLEIWAAWKRFDDAQST